MKSYVVVRSDTSSFSHFFFKLRQHKPLLPFSLLLPRPPRIDLGGGLEVRKVAEVAEKVEKEEKFRRLTVRLPKSLFVELTTLAATLEKTKEELVQEAVKDLVEKYKNKR